MSPPQPTRSFLKEPEKDPGIQPPLGQYKVDQTTPGLDETKQDVPAEKTIPVPAVGDCVKELAIEQLRLLGVALRHARDSKFHQGQIVFSKRTNPYAGGDWGLEIIDKGETQGATVFPLYVVFVEPKP